MGVGDVRRPRTARQPGERDRREPHPGRRRARPRDRAAREKWRAFGWWAESVDGNDIERLLDVFEAARGVTGRPKASSAERRSGLGVPLIMKRERNHFVRVGDDEWDAVARQLEATREPPRRPPAVTRSARQGRPLRSRDPRDRRAAARRGRSFCRRRRGDRARSVRAGVPRSIRERRDGRGEPDQRRRRAGEGGVHARRDHVRRVRHAPRARLHRDPVRAEPRQREDRRRAPRASTRPSARPIRGSTTSRTCARCRT